MPGVSPSLGDIGQYDSSTDPLVGGADNPYPQGYPSKPTLAGEYGQDTNSDYFSNLNFWASGTVHGPSGYESPSEGLLRGVEFIATWFSYAVASPQEGGAVAKPEHGTWLSGPTGSCCRPCRPPRRC